MSDDRRFYEAPAASDSRRSAPAAIRNREPIAEFLEQWLPDSGLVLEIASGTGEHAIYFAERFPALEWQPSDSHPNSLASIRAWVAGSLLPNVRQPILIDAAASEWPVGRVDALLNINMVHISPWSASLGLLDGAARVLRPAAPLIFYGPWLSDTIEAAASNLDFDSDLKRRDSEWGLRNVERFAAEAAARGFGFVEQRQMPANNLMLLFRNGTV